MQFSIITLLSLAALAVATPISIVGTFPPPFLKASSSCIEDCLVIAEADTDSALSTSTTNQP